MNETSASSAGYFFVAATRRTDKFADLLRCGLRLCFTFLAVGSPRQCMVAHAVAERGRKKYRKTVRLPIAAKMKERSLSAIIAQMPSK